jgi:DNA mismatch repair protein MutS2
MQMKKEILHQQSLTALGWPEVIDFLSRQASSPMTVARCRSLPFLNDPDAVREALAAVWEVAALLKKSGDLPLSPFPDLHPLFVRAAKGASLEGPELRSVLHFLEQVRTLRSFLLSRSEEAPHLLQWAVPLDALEPLRKKIDGAIDEEGQVKESATPALRALKIEAAKAREAMIEQLDGMLRSPRYEKLLQESYYTEREGRYVLPFKIAHQNKEGGVVHDLSASGATAFVEPKELVIPNNRLRVAQLSVAREVERILKSLSEAVGEEGERLQRDLALFIEIDLVRAKAKLSERIGGILPLINTTGKLNLIGVRHPLLLLRSSSEGVAKPVVPNDIFLEEERRAMVLSGPNAGGKTVVLKTLGLFALMIRAGLPIPCREDSEMALFPEVVADIGDDQDLSRDLSSFSAHLENILSILSLPQGTLVLLDELVTSTDPAEGAALAEAILIEMVDRGMKVITTTHYPSLKGLAQTDPRFLNASLGFDLERLAPTYRLVQGIPGRSAGLEIAARLGLDDAILQRAKTRLNETERALDRLIADLERERRQAEEERRRSASLRQEMEAAAKAQQEAMAHLALSEKEIKKRVKQKVNEAVTSARAEIGALLQSLRAETDPSEVKKGRERLVRIEERAEKAVTSIPASRIPPQVGKRVEVVPLGREGILLDSPAGAKKVRVQMGNQILLISPESLEGIAEEAQKAAEPDPPTMPAVKPESPTEAELKLHGERVEEALERLERFLDHALLSDIKEVRVVHGQGTGKLKKAVRAYLAASPYVVRSRPADLLEGGDGVTLVQLSS